MNQVSITELKKLSVAELKAKIPIQVTADGAVVAEVNLPGKSMVGTKTKCPNCKMEFTVKPTDGKPFFFTGKHPK